MKKIFILLLQWIALCPLQGQNIQPIWVRSEINNGGGAGNQLPFVLTDVFHNVILCTYTYHPGPLTGFSTSKYDQGGNFLWKRTYQTIATDLITAASTDATGAVHVGGNSYDITSGQAQFIVFKYAANGDSLWSYTYVDTTARGNFLAKLLVLPDQDVLVVGSFRDIPTNNAGLLVSRLHSDGSIVWEATYDAGEYSYSARDAVLADNRLIVWGRTGSPEGLRFFCWQLDLSGTTLNAEQSEPYIDDFQNCFFTDREGSFYVGDYAGEYKITKFKVTGETAWEYNKPVTTPNPNGVNARLFCIQTDTLGNVYGSGLFYVDPTGLVCLTTKIDSNGVMLWEHSLHETSYGFPFPRSSKMTDNGLLLVTGPISVNLDSNFYQFFLAVYDSDGLVKSGVTVLNGPRNTSNAIWQDDNSAYVTGVSYPYSASDPVSDFLCKYNLPDLISFAIEPSRQILQLAFHPNPFQDVLSLDMPDCSGSCFVSVMNSQGQVLSSQQYELTNGSLRIEHLMNLASGIYTITVYSGTDIYLGRAVKL